MKPPDQLRINVGCGMAPVPGWMNVDNSPSVRLAGLPILADLLFRIGALDRNQFEFVGYCRSEHVTFADGAKRIPADGGSADVVYACYVIDLLDRQQTSRFLAEAGRVLRPGGILRIVVTDLERLVEEYRRHGSADRFMSNLLVLPPRRPRLARRLQQLVTGNRAHKWAYDRRSLARLLEEHGFSRPVALSPGETKIPDPGGLDLSPQAEHRPLYMEAFWRG